jgi:hypothetical protein
VTIGRNCQTHRTQNPGRRPNHGRPRSLCFDAVRSLSERRTILQALVSAQQNGFDCNGRAKSTDGNEVAAIAFLSPPYMIGDRWGEC